MTPGLALTLLLHPSMEHGLASPWLLVPLGIIAAFYYALVGVEAKVKERLEESLSRGLGATVTIEELDAPLPRGPTVLSGVRVQGGDALPRGVTLELASVTADVGLLALLGERVEVNRLEVRASLPGGETLDGADPSRTATTSEGSADGVTATSDEAAVGSGGKHRVVAVGGAWIEELRITRPPRPDGTAEESVRRNLRIDSPELAEGRPVATLAALIVKAIVEAASTADRPAGK